MKNTLTINPKFAALIPPLADEELAQLEANIIADGCREPLAVWKRDNDRVIVDGHNRYHICTKLHIDFETVDLRFDSEDDACEWIIKNQFGRRNLTVFVRGKLVLQLEGVIAKRAKENQAAGGGDRKSGLTTLSKAITRINTRAELAKLAGLSEGTMAKVKYIEENADEITKAELSRPDTLSVNKAFKDTKDKKQQLTRREKRTRQAVKSLVAGIIVGDFRKHSDKVADGSLSMIFTDPPYDVAAIELFKGLAEFGEAKLADGGSLFCYVGHHQVAEAIAALSTQLRFWWPCACFHSGGKTLMREYGIRVGWKPILWFVKGTRDDKQNILFDVVTGETRKEFHDWQQDETEAAYFISHLCPEDGIVCDPFLGGGTTAVAAKNLKRKWIGFEIDPKTAAIASGRLES